MRRASRAAGCLWLERRCVTRAADRQVGLPWRDVAVPRGQDCPPHGRDGDVERVMEAVIENQLTPGLLTRSYWVFAGATT